MCGIAGIFGSVEPYDIQAVLDAMRHRGPDDRGVLVLDGGLLGARRLSIIDVAGGHQPVQNESGSVGAAFNGEIYNHPALRRDLTAAGHRLRSGCDTELLPHLYEEMGSGMLALLRGMFAIAIWDGENQRGLLARDRMGEKPLFYVRLDDGIVFASELSALLQHPGVTSRLSLDALQLYLTLGYVPGKQTMIEGVSKLGPGERLVFSRGAVSVERWWDLVPSEPGYGVSADGATEELRGLLADAVAAQRDADVPVGVLLSGGIDSAGITSLMVRDADPRSVRTFTVGFEDSPFDERAPARSVAEALGTNHTELEVATPSFGTLLEVFASLDEPIADQAAFPTFLIAREASRHVKVVLTGEGSDELFGGYNRYRWTNVANALSRAPALVLATGRRVGRTLGAKRSEQLDLLLHPGSPLARRLDWIGIVPAAQVDRLLEWGNASARTLERLEQISAPFGVTGVEMDMLLDARTWLVDDILTKADRMTMACSLEGRAPYLDHRVVEFATSLPPSLRLGRGQKWLLRSALKGVVPEVALNRRKRAFRAPVADWMQGSLRDSVIGMLLDPDAVSTSLFARGELERIAVGGAGGDPVFWSLAALEGWARGLRARGVALDLPR
jgi:asparagine synthase (glutamine-hydrolysing)